MPEASADGGDELAGLSLEEVIEPPRRSQRGSLTDPACMRHSRDGRRGLD